VTRAYIARAGLLVLVASLLSLSAVIVTGRLREAIEPGSLRTRVEALSFEPPAGWIVEDGGEAEIRARFGSAGLDDSDGSLDRLGVNERTRALALLVEDGEPRYALRGDFLPTDGGAPSVGVRDAAILSVGLGEDPFLERFEGGVSELYYAGYRAGEGLARRSVVFVSFVPGIVRLTILAPDSVADLLIATILYDPPPAPDASPEELP